MNISIKTGSPLKSPGRTVLLVLYVIAVAVAYYVILPQVEVS